jgi:hypothetical protein
MHIEHACNVGVKTYLLGLFRSTLDTTGQTSHVPIPSDGGDFDSGGDASKARLLIPGGKVDKDTFEKVCMYIMLRECREVCYALYRFPSYDMKI